MLIVVEYFVWLFGWQNSWQFLGRLLRHVDLSIPERSHEANLLE